jgi:sporulation protein YlmC with PRC-barrel domain
MDNVRETSILIAADKVQGADVFNTGGDRLGSIHDLMIDKQTGSPTRSYRLADSSESETATIRFPGRCCDTT